MKTVWKYSLQIRDEIQEIKMPYNSTILHVGFQKDFPCLWVEVDAEEKETSRYFKIYGTGHVVVLKYVEYRGTCFDEKLGLVWHVYEVFGIET